MRRVKNALLVFFTLALVAAGAVMPFIAARWQDARQTGAEVRGFDSFSLTLMQEADLSQILRAVSSGSYYMREAAKSDGAALTEGMALEAAEDVLMRLVDYELLDNAVRAELSNPSIRAQQVIPLPTEWEDWEAARVAAGIVSDDDAGLADAFLDAGTPIPTWTIVWDTPDYFYIWLDDASGKAIEITAYMSPDGFGDVYRTAERWRLFLEDYYGVEVALSDAEWREHDVGFQLDFRLGDEQFHLSLDLYTEGIAVLNPWD